MSRVVSDPSPLFSPNPRSLPGWTPSERVSERVRPRPDLLPGVPSGLGSCGDGGPSVRSPVSLLKEVCSVQTSTASPSDPESSALEVRGPRVWGRELRHFGSHTVPSRHVPSCGPPLIVTSGFSVVGRRRVPGHPEVPPPPVSSEWRGRPGGGWTCWRTAVTDCRDTS